MKGQTTGVIEKVFPIKQIDGKRFLQEFKIVEQPRRANDREKPYIIQNWADSKQELEKMYLDDRVGEEVRCDVYINGYEYHSQKFGTQYGTKISLIKIENA